MTPFIHHGPRFYIDNADVQMMILMVDAAVVPLVVSRCLTSMFSDCAIVFPSVNRGTDDGLFDALRKNHFRMVAARTVYLFDPARASSTKHKNQRRDQILLRESPYEIVGAGELTDDDSFSTNGATITGNLMGYDLELPAHDGLYRQLFAMAMNEATASGRL